MAGLTMAIDELAFADLTKEIKITMRRSAKDAVQLGYMLRRVMEEGLYLADYNDFDTYLDKELRMDYTLATRFIGINKKFSFLGRSMDIAAEYEQYSQGLLIEMLNMTPEQEAKVTPDMTVKQAREIKRKDRRPEPVPEPEPPAVEAPVPEKEEVIIDGEFREIEEPEKVATSQLEKEAASCDPAAAESGEDLPCEGCAYNGVGGCGYPGTKDDYCVMGNKRIPAGQDSPEESESDEESTEDYKSIEFARRILQENQKLLQDYLDVDGLPEETVERQRLITAALAAAVCDLEDSASEAEEQSDQDEPDADQESTQPELPILRNADQRKEWLANYKAWGLWYRDEHIDVNYYKYDFPDGSRLVVAEYPQRSCYWNSRKKMDEHYFHLLEKKKLDYSKRAYDVQYGQSSDSETYLVDFLKRLQKGGGK